MIKLKDVMKIYGEGESEVRALDGVTLEIPEGKFVSIVGKSGSGKSTLLNMIGALDKVTSGTVEIDGTKIDDLTDDELAEYRNKNIGYIFQAFYLEPEFTVMENVEMPLIIAGIDKKTRREKASAIIEKLGIADKENQKVRTLSGGQKQRVSIARALVVEPKMILADEPTGNLDVKNAQEVIRLLREIVEEGKTVILVTHNMDDAAKADIKIEIRDGKIAGVEER